MTDEPFLLDTCTFLDWALGTRVGTSTLKSIEAGAREGRVYLSPLSVQEVMRLAEKGRLDLRPTPLSWTQRALRRMRLEELPFTWEGAREAGTLIDVNGDPVDRGLLGTAIAAGMTLVTRDDDLLEAGRRKGVAVLDSRR
ncbi:MAG: type II toxin-antitoxin system VapC family toxin [Myxococcaceae bacterium]